MAEVTVNFDFRDEIADAGTDPSDGFVQVDPATIENVDELGAHWLRTNETFMVMLPTGVGSMLVREGYYWIRPRGLDAPKRLIFVTGAGPLNYSDLPSIDPVSLDPLPGPHPAWEVPLAAEVERATGREDDLQTQITDGDYANAQDITNEVLRAQGIEGDLRTDLDSHVADAANPHSVTKAQVGLDQAENTSDADKPISSAAQAALDDKADLVAGLVPTSQIPAIAIGTGQAVANRAAMLALTNVQQGDFVSITATADKGTYILNDPNPSIFGHWLVLSVPTDVVQSVNGQTGPVVLGKADIGLGSANDTSDANKPVSIAQGAINTTLAAADTAEANTRAQADTANANAIAAEVLNRRADLRKVPAVVADLCNSLGVNGTLLNYGTDTLSGAIVLGSLSYFAFAVPQTQGRFRYGGYAGHVGYTSSQLLTDHLPAMLAATAVDYVHLQVMTNDEANGISVATTVANIDSMVAQIKAAGKIPILATQPPVDSQNTGSALTHMTQRNAYVKAKARREGLPIADYHRDTVNPSDNTWRAGYSSDGIHPTVAGAAAMGAVLAAVLNALGAALRFGGLSGSYNPDLMAPDAVATSAVSGDKIAAVGSINVYRLIAGIAGGKWAGNLILAARGGVANFGINWPCPAAVVTGHRTRVAFAFEALNMPTNATWNAYLLDSTDLLPVAGFSAVAGAMTKPNAGGALVTDGVTTSASKTISSASAPFRPWHVGCQVSSGTGLSSDIAAGITIVGVSADGTQATLSAAATTSRTSSVLVVHGEPLVSVWEFDMPAGCNGDTLVFNFTVGGAANSALAIAQVTVEDLTALGAA